MVGRIPAFDSLRAREVGPPNLNCSLQTVAGNRRRRADGTIGTPYWAERCDGRLFLWQSVNGPHRAMEGVNSSLLTSMRDTVRKRREYHQVYPAESAALAQTMEDQVPRNSNVNTVALTFIALAVRAIIRSNRLSKAILRNRSPEIRDRGQSTDRSRSDQVT